MKDYLSNPLISMDEKDVAAYWLKQAKIQVEKIELSEERLMEIAGESIFSGDRLQTYQFHPDQLVRFTGKPNCT